jgi:hypothetical protein
MGEISIPPQSFCVCVHACNDANKTVVRMAQQASAGYATMPCCVSDNLYSVHSRHLPDDTRHAVMCGVMAGTYGAHTVTQIDRRITNRHLILFGGYASLGSLTGTTGSVQPQRHDRVADWNGRGGGAARVEKERPDGRQRPSRTQRAAATCGVGAIPTT